MCPVVLWSIRWGRCLCAGDENKWMIHAMLHLLLLSKYKLLPMTSQLRKPLSNAVRSTWLSLQSIQCVWSGYSWNSNFHNLYKIFPRMITLVDCVHQEHLMGEKEWLQFNAITPEIKIYLRERKLEIFTEKKKNRQATQADQTVGGHCHIWKVELQSNPK